jgi:hypothetical protein
LIEDAEGLGMSNKTIEDFRREAVPIEVPAEGIHTMEGFMPQYTAQGMRDIIAHGVEGIDKHPLAFEKKTPRSGKKSKVNGK